MNGSAGNIYLITAPSGAGKSSLVNALLESDASLQLSVSCTTRSPREGEVDGRDYHFVTLETFERMQDAGDLLESAHVHGNYYGTPKGPLAKALEFGTDMVLEIDWQGAQQVRRSLPAVTGIFILPPSLEALHSRLRARGTDSEDVIARRLAAASGEIAHAAEFDYVIINRDFSIALEQLQHIVGASRLKYARQALLQSALFDSYGLPR
jgi:guanylate kinase